MEQTGEWFRQERLPFDGRKDAKNLRIRALEPLVTNGGLHVGPTMSALLEELELYPHSHTVDILDCLGYLMKVAKAPLKETAVNVPDPFCIDEIEKELKARSNSASGYPFDFQLRGLGLIKEPNSV